MIMQKTFYRIVYIILSLVILFGFVFGYIYTTSRINNSQAVKDYVSHEDTNIVQNQILKSEDVINQNDIKNAVLVKRTIYKVCGHNIDQKSMLPKEQQEFTLEQFKELYSEYNIEKFSPEEIIISKQLNLKCPNHFIVKEKDGKVAVLYQIPVGGISVKEITNIDVSNLSITDQERLRLGIIINSNEKLAEILEDFGS